MADPPPPPYPGADPGPSFPSDDTTKQPIPSDGPGEPGYPPQPTPGYPPQPEPGYPPQPTPGYPPQPEPGYPPQPTPGYPPQPEPGYPSQPTPGYPPQPSSGYPSQPTSGHSSQPTPGYPPQPTPGYPPQSTPGYLPQVDPANPAPLQVALPGSTGYPSQPTAGYPTAGYQLQPGYPGYPHKGNNQHRGYAPVATGYPPPGQGYVQQPTGYTATNTNTTVVVTQQPTITAAVIPYVNDYMGLSIFSCLCCCWCIGLFAIIKSSEARSNYDAGNYTQALASATSARNLSYISIFCGIGIAILFIIIVSV